MPSLESFCMWELPTVVATLVRCGCPPIISSSASISMAGNTAMQPCRMAAAQRPCSQRHARQQHIHASIGQKGKSCRTSIFCLDPTGSHTLSSISGQQGSSLGAGRTACGHKEQKHSRPEGRLQAVEGEGTLSGRPACLWRPQRSEGTLSQCSGWWHPNPAPTPWHPCTPQAISHNRQPLFITKACQH